MRGDSIPCPFCGEQDFNLVGLKIHLERGWCSKYDELDARTTIEREVQRRQDEASEG
jgi:hypothetical protein